jgi:hypothetical protein
LAAVDGQSWEIVTTVSAYVLANFSPRRSFFFICIVNAVHSDFLALND